MWENKRSWRTKAAVIIAAGLGMGLLTSANAAAEVSEEFHILVDRRLLLRRARRLVDFEVRAEQLAHRHAQLVQVVAHLIAEQLQR